MNDNIRDSNHTLRYVLIRTKRSFRENAAPHFTDLWIAGVDLINATMRAFLGLGGVIFSVLGEACFKSQTKWVRK